MPTAPSRAQEVVPRNVMTSLSGFLADENQGRLDVSIHAANVARQARALAADVGIGGNDLNVLALAVRFHDVGKLKTPLSILQKNGALTGDELHVMAAHSIEGARMLSAIEDVPTIMLDVARYHHERYNGLGTEGLRGEDIPFAARITQVADVHDALVSDRSYRKGMSEEQALSIMTSPDASARTSRHDFDPVLLRRFVGLRLKSPEVDLPASARAELAAFAASDPNDDLSPEMREHVEFDADGSRTVFDRIDGERVAVARVTRSGGREAPDEPAPEAPAFR